MVRGQACAVSFLDELINVSVTRDLFSIAMDCKGLGDAGDTFSLTCNEGKIMKHFVVLVLLANWIAISEYSLAVELQYLEMAYGVSVWPEGRWLRQSPGGGKPHQQ